MPNPIDCNRPNNEEEGTHWIMLMNVSEGGVQDFILKTCIKETVFLFLQRTADN